MRLPGAADYMEALQDPATCFADPELSAASAVLTPLGLPRAVSGNVAVVFRLDGDDGRSWAVRCFVRPVDEERARYEAIRDHLAGLDATWAVPFDVQPCGIRIGGRWWPVLKMEWAAGEPLLSYVRRHLWNGAGLRYLAARFLALATNLRAAGVAHGDLQHGNILVAPGGDLRLVDYDGMYVPALAGWSGTERGHRNYQHPGREVDDFGPALDTFSSWVIYASLAALAADPLLWGRFDGGEEALLLRHYDLEAPGRSAALAAMEASRGPGVAELARMLRSFLSLEPSEVPPFVAGLAPPLVRPAAAAVAVAAGAAAMREAWAVRSAIDPSVAPPPPRPVATPDPPAGELPAGAGHVIEADDDSRRSLYEALTAAPGDKGAPAFHAAAGPVRFSGDLNRPRAILAGGTGASVVVLLVLLAAGASPVIALVAALTIAGATLRRLARLFRATPEAQGARAVGAVLAEPRRALDEALAFVGRLEERRRRVAAVEAAAIARAEEDRAVLRAGQEDELRVVEADLDAILAGLADRERSIGRSEQQARAVALAELQGSVMDAQLGQHSLVMASSFGLSETVVHRLAMDDVRTAADFTAVEVERTGAVVVRRDGRRLQVGGVDQRQADAMLTWKRRVAGAAQLKVPDALTPDRVAAIRADHDRRRAALASEAEAARTAARKQAEEIRRRWQARYDEVDGRRKEAEADANGQRVELDRALALARKDVAEAEWHLARSHDGSGPPPDLGLADYLRHLVAVGPLAGLGDRPAGAHASRGGGVRRPPLEL